MTNEFPHPLLEQIFNDHVERYTLPNGLTVIHKDDPGGLVSAQVWVKTGSIHEGALLGAGLSHYLEHMLFKGTSRRNAQQLTAEIQALGGGINAYTTFDRTVYYVDAPSEATAQVLDILADMVFCSVLAPTEVERERDVILREIDMTLDDPDRQVSRALFEQAFRSHPFRHPVIGHRELFEKITAEDLQAYYRSRYVPQNITLVVVGDLSADELRPLVEKTFGPYPRSLSSSPLIPSESPQLGPRRLRLEGDVSVCRGGMAFRVPSISHPDAPGLDLLAAILGGGESSLLWKSLRIKQQLVHEIDCSCWNPGQEGLFWISYICDTGRTDEVESAIIEELAVIGQSGIPAAEVDKARRQAAVSEINSRRTVSGQAARLGVSEVVVGDLSYSRYYFHALEKATPELLSATLQRYLAPQLMTSVALDAPRQKNSRARVAKQVLPDFEELKFKNGARLLMQRDSRLPKVHIRYCGLGGPLYENARKRGVTQLMATLLTRDTRFRNESKVAAAVESLGGSFHEFCGNNAFGLSIEMLAQDIDTGVRILHEALSAPAFKPETVARERSAQLSRLKEEYDEIADRGRSLLRRAFFGSHPLGIAAEGDLKTIENLDADDVAAQFQRLVVAPNSVFVVCGDFDPDRIVPLLAPMIDGIDPFRFNRAQSDFQGPLAQDIVEVMNREQAVVFHSYQGAGITEEDYLASELLDEIFSDMSGPLFHSVREEKGLAYFVGATRLVGVDTGMFTLYGGTSPETADQLRSEFDLAVDRVRKSGLTPEELSRAQARLKAHRRMGLQTIGARAATVGLDVLYGLPLNNWRTYDARMDALTVDDVTNFACKRLDPNRRVTLQIGPANEEAKKAG